MAFNNVIPANLLSNPYYIETVRGREWYWFDEDKGKRVGPFSSEEEAKEDYERNQR